MNGMFIATFPDAASQGNAGWGYKNCGAIEGLDRRSWFMRKKLELDPKSPPARGWPAGFITNETHAVAVNSS